MIAIPDLSSFRRIPWENDIPFFLLSFYDPNTRAPLAVCPRGVLKRVTDELASLGWEAMCGIELEFYNFKGNAAFSVTTLCVFFLHLLRFSLAVTGCQCALKGLWKKDRESGRALCNFAFFFTLTMK
jgi:glutamine synthetase